MKLKWLILPLCLILGAALWGVNYRLNNPPLSAADKQFRASVKGADSVTLSLWDLRHLTIGSAHPSRTLNAAQTRELIAHIRLSDASAPQSGVPTVVMALTFSRAGKPIAGMTIQQNARSSRLMVPVNSATSNRNAIVTMSASFNVYQIHPRFEKPLRAYLDEVGPRP